MPIQFVGCLEIVKEGKELQWLKQRNGKEDQQSGLESEYCS